MNYDTKSTGRPSIRHDSIIKTLNSPAIMATCILKTINIYSDPIELCDKLRLLLQEKHGGNTSDINDEEIIATIDKLLEYKSISKKQHKQILVKCNLLRNQV